MTLCTLLLFALAAAVGLLMSSIDCAAVFGFDLGTASSKIAMIRTGKGMEIVLNAHSQRKTPTAIAYRNGAPVFGSDAINLVTNKHSKGIMSNFSVQAARFPATTFMRVNSLLGASNSSEAFTHYQQHFANELVPEPTRDSLLYAIDGSQRPIEELVGLYLEHLRVQAETYAGLPHSGCIITVPAYFAQRERQALLDAAELAGLRVSALTTDIAAIALYNGLSFANRAIGSSDEPQNIVFYDSGAGHTSAAVVRFDPSYVNGKQNATLVDVKAIITDANFGGFWLDERIGALLAEKFSLKNPGVAIKRGKSMNMLLAEANRIKLLLSANQEAFASVDDLVDDLSLHEKVTRHEIEQIFRSESGRITFVIDQVLSTAGMSLKDIAEVVVLGGHSHVPFVMDTLRAYAGSKLSLKMNREESAAQGAAFYAAMLDAGFRTAPIVFRDAFAKSVELAYSGPSGAGEKPIVIFPAFSPLKSSKDVSFKRFEPIELTVSYQDGMLFHGLIDGIEDAKKKMTERNLAGQTKMRMPFALNAHGLVEVGAPHLQIDYETEMAVAPKPSDSSISGEALQVKTEKIKKTEYLPLSLTTTASNQRMSAELKKVSSDRMALIRAEEDRKRQKAAARNRLEAAVYRLRDAKQSKLFIGYAAKDELGKMASAVEAGAKLVAVDTTAEAYLNALEPIEKLEAAIKQREIEREAWPKAAAALASTIDNIFQYAHDTLSLVRQEQRGATDVELVALEAEALAAKKWLEQVEKQHVATPLNKLPPVLATALDAKAKLLIDSMEALKTKPKPKPKSKPRNPAPKNDTNPDVILQEKQDAMAAPNVEPVDAPGRNVPPEAMPEAAAEEIQQPQHPLPTSQAEHVDL